MTEDTVLAGGNMAVGFAPCLNTVMTALAVAGNTIMIHVRRQPARGAVTGHTISTGTDMGS